MAEITMRRQGEIVRKLFEILSTQPEGMAAKDAIARLSNELQLSDFEKSEYPKRPGVVRFPKMVRFSTINAVKAGWLTKERGTWTLTDEGRQALSDYSDPEELYRRSNLLYKRWEAERSDPESDAATDAEDDTGGALAAASLEEAEEAARSDIQEYLSALNPYRFQDLVGKLLEAMGYHVVWIAPRGKDGGLDLLAQSDPLGVQGPRIKGQVKRRSEKVGAEELRSFLSLIEDNDRGVFISLSGFTSDAGELARRSARRITLLDGDALFELWIDHFDELDEEGRGLLPVKPVYFLDVEG